MLATDSQQACLSSPTALGLGGGSLGSCSPFRALSVQNSERGRREMHVLSGCSGARPSRGVPGDDARTPPLAVSQELFVQYLATCSYRHGSGRAKKALTYSDLASTAEESETFQFLADILPKKILASKYLKTLKEKREEEEENDDESEDDGALS